MEKDVVISKLSEALKEHIEDEATRWTVVERLYRDIIKACEDDVKEDYHKLFFPKRVD